MFEINDVVVYGQNGVCHVVDVCPSPFDKKDTREFYVLRPALNTDHSTIYVPVEATEGKIRPLMTAEEARDVLSRIEEIAPLVVEAEKMRRDLYRQTVVEARPEGYVAVLKAVARRRADAIRAKRQLAGADAEYEQKAKSFLALELSYALGGDPKEYAASIMERVSTCLCTL